MALWAFDAMLSRPSLNFVWRRWWPVWEAALRRADRYGLGGRGGQGLGFGWYLERLGAHAELEAAGWEPGEYEPPMSLPYFIARLDSATKHWRHAARHNAGRCGDGCRATKEYVRRPGEPAGELDRRLWEHMRERARVRALLRRDGWEL